MTEEKIEAQPDETTHTAFADGSTERPEWLPEKFESPEAMAASYAELEQKLGGGRPPDPETPTDLSLDPGPTPESMSLSEVEDKLRASFATNGALTDEDYALAEAKGRSRASVDRQLAGERALAQQQFEETARAVGGVQEMKNALDWAAKNLTREEQERYNAAMEADPTTAALGLHSRYRASNGRGPTLLEGNRISSSSGAFESQREMLDFVQVKDSQGRLRVDTDPKYAAEYTAKMLKSSNEVIG